MNKEKALSVLSRDVVMELGLDKVDVITSDMIEEYTIICTNAFWRCSSLTSIDLPNSIISIGNCAFDGCYSITSIIIPNSVKTIKYYAFSDCFALTSIIIPNSITRIEKYAFRKCKNLKNVVIGDKAYKNHKIIKNKCKAYKAFNANMTCRKFQYEEGKTYEIEDNTKLCEHGFHACLNLLDVFNYYNGIFGKDIVVHEVELEGVSEERRTNDSKVVAKKITIGKRIL